MHEDLESGFLKVYLLCPKTKKTKKETHTPRRSDTHFVHHIYNSFKKVHIKNINYVRDY